MRWILIVLLMCNGIYFLWQNYLTQNERPASVAAAVPAAQAGTSLVLLSEQSPTAATAAAGASSGPGKAGTANVAAPAADVAGPAGRSDIGLVAPSDTTTDHGAGICWQIGPFREEVSGKQVVTRLAALDISLRLETVEIPGKPDYWVHIPPQVSRKAAIKLLRELQSKEIDSFLITEGALENGLSLGFFTQKNRADKVFEQRLKQGYDAKIKVVPRTRTELWAVFDTGESGKFSDALWDKIREGNRGLERRKNYCDKIASTDNFD